MNSLESPSWAMCRYYDELEIYGSRRHLGYTYAYAARRHHILELIAKVAAPGARIIDVAAAQGNFSIALTERNYDVTWNDIRADLIPYVQQKAGTHQLQYRSGNIFDLNEIGVFDVALVAEVIEHVAHPDEFLRRIAELVRPGGHIVLTTPNGRYFRNRLPRFSECRDFTVAEQRQFGPDADDHIFLLHPDELHTIVSAADLELVDLRFHGNTLTAGSLRSEALLQIAPAPIVHAIERFSTQLPRPIRERVHMGMAVLLRKPGTSRSHEKIDGDDQA